MSKIKGTAGAANLLTNTKLQTVVNGGDGGLVFI